MSTVPRRLTIAAIACALVLSACSENAEPAGATEDPGSCVAGDAGTIDGGGVVTASLELEDCVLKRGAKFVYADGYAFVLDREATIRVEMDVDTFFTGEIHITDNDLRTVVTSEGPRLIETLRAGTYIMWARSAEEQSVGRYSLRYSKQCDPDPTAGYALGEIVVDTLTRSSCVFPGTGSWARAYPVALDRFLTIRVDLSSPEFSVNLRIGDTYGRMIDFPQRVSLQRIVAEMNRGTYFVWVSSEDVDALGEYLLTVEKAPDPCSIDRSVGQLALGEPKAGTPYIDECTHDLGGLSYIVHTWDLDLPSFSPVAIGLTSAPEVAIFAILDEAGTVIINGYNPQGSDALQYTLPAGRYQVRTGLDLVAGPYEFVIDTVPVPTCTRRPIQVGQVVTGLAAETACPMSFMGDIEDAVFFELDLQETRTVHFTIEQWEAGNTTPAIADSRGVMLDDRAPHPHHFMRELEPGLYTLSAIGKDPAGPYWFSLLADEHLPRQMDISTPPDTMTIGDIAQLTAVPRYANGELIVDEPVTWGSSNPAILSVDSTGLVTAHGQGFARISATSRSVSDYVQIESQPAPCTDATHGTIALGQVVMGELTTADCGSPGILSFAHGYRFSLAQPTFVRFEIEMIGGVNLTITDNQLNVTGGGSPQDGSTAVISSLEAGEHIIWVSSATRGGMGQYVLSAVTAPGECTPSLASGTISLGEVVAGELTDTDCFREGTSDAADGYTFVLDEPTDLVLQTASGGFEIIITDADMNQVGFAGDSDRGVRFAGHLDAGTYIAWVTRWDSYAPYQLALSKLPPLCTAGDVDGVIAVNSSVSGNLQAGTCTLHGIDGAYAHGWTISVPDLTVVVVDLVTELPNTMLAITDTAMNPWGATPDPLRQVQGLLHTFMPGTHIIWAGTYPFPTADGAYQLAVSPGTASQCMIGSIQVGDVVNGSIGPDDCPARSGRANVRELVLTETTTLRFNLTTEIYTNALYVVNEHGVIAGMLDNIEQGYTSDFIVTLPAGAYTVWSVASDADTLYELSVQAQTN